MVVRPAGPQRKAQVPIVTDGTGWRPPGSGVGPAGGGADAGSGFASQGSHPARHPPPPWGSDALARPWRDPAAPTAVVVRPPAVPPPPDPQDPPAGGGRARGLSLIFVVALVTALLAGALGGTLGYLFATRDGTG